MVRWGLKGGDSSMIESWMLDMSLDEIFGYEDPPETSEHFKHAVTYDLREVRGLVPPLAVGEPVPGCPCEDCTGISEDHDVRPDLPV